MEPGRTLGLLEACRLGVGELVIDWVAVAGQGLEKPGQTQSKDFLVPLKSTFGRDDVEECVEHLVMYRREDP